MTHSLLNLLRVMLYALAIVFVGQMHNLALLSVTLITGAILVFTVCERPWKDAEVQKLAIINEVILYLLLVLVTGSLGISKLFSRENHLLGYLIIALVTLAIYVNLVMMCAQAWYHVKMLRARSSNTKRAKIMEDLKPKSDLMKVNMAAPSKKGKDVDLEMVELGGQPMQIGELPVISEEESSICEGAKSPSPQLLGPATDDATVDGKDSIENMSNSERGVNNDDLQDEIN